MQTRRRTQLAATAELPQLPVAVQLCILDQAVRQYPFPDTEDYTVWPYRSTLGWLLTLGRVCTSWHKHLQQHPILVRRTRLEQLRNLSLLHDFAYCMISTGVSKQQRIKKVPRQICLHFADGSRTTFDVPKGGVVGATKVLKSHQQQGNTPTQASTSGLPTHALMLVTWSHQITSSALLELLADLDRLDSHHVAPMVVQVRNICTQSEVSEDYDEALDSKEQVEAIESSFASLGAAVLPAITGVLRDVVQEGDSSCKALTFIPTKQGFCRCVPAA